MKKTHKEVEIVVNKIINKSLIVGSIIGLLSFIASLKFNIKNDYLFFVALDFFVVASFFTVALLRKKLSHTIKSSIIVIGLFILTLGSVFKVGIFADSKVLLILIPVFAFLGYSLKNTIIIYISAIIGFICLGYIHINGIIVSNVNLSQRALSTSAWINNTLLLSIVSFVVIIIIIKFNNTFFKLIADLKNKNSQLEKYKTNLETLIQERTKELKDTNNELNYSNKELKTAISTLQSTQESLIQSEKMALLGVLASGVAHEINNPLNFIQGGIIGIELFLEDNLQKEQINKIAPFIGGIKEGVKRASNIVTSLNHFSRDNDSGAEICDIHVIINNCLTMLNNKLKHKIKVIKNYTQLPIGLKCNDSRLHQAVLNILSNAEQAINKKGVIEITTTIEQQNIKITISDTGCGIKEDIISRISNPFFTTKEVGKGTGLGLSIAYKIIEDSKGTIKHISKEGEGTKVIILLPLSTNQKRQE